MPAYMPALQSRHFDVGWWSFLCLWDPEKDRLLGVLFFHLFFSSGYSECLRTIWLIIRIFYLGVDKCHLLCYCNALWGMWWENSVALGSGWGAWVASVRAAVDAIGDHQVGEENGSTSIACLQSPWKKNTTGFFKVCCEQRQCVSVMNLRPSESMGFRNVMIAVLKRQ